jgi:hypothetical protein
LAWYHIIFLNLETKHSSRKMIERESDADALKYARAAFAKQRAFSRFELWQQGRLLHQEVREPKRWLLRRTAPAR